MTDQKTDDVMRLNKFIAYHDGISRREADDLIAAGKVKVNSEVAILGERVAGTDEITLNGQVLDRRKSYTTIAFNKPVGYVCSRKQQGDTPTIYEIIPKQFHHLKTVGRLDRDSSGIILLTDNGDLSHQMTHPSFYKTKTYEVELDQPLQPLHRQMISDYGVQLEDGNSKFELERIETESNDPDTKWQIIMSEGRNRQIRRTFSSLGYTVTKLHRTQFGKYSLGDLSSKDYTSITD